MSDTEHQREQEDYHLQTRKSANHHEDEELKLESSQGGTTGEFEFDPQVVTAARIEDDDYLSQQQQREIGEQIDTQGDEFEDESGAVIIPRSPRGATKDDMGISVTEGSSIAMEMLPMQMKEKQAQVVAGINNTKFS